MPKWSGVGALLLIVCLLPAKAAVAQTVRPELSCTGAIGGTPTIVDNGPGDLDPRPRVIRGGPGNDVIHGTEGDDTIIDTFAEGGFSVVCARAGKDQIEVSGPPGFGINAHVDAGAGNDTVIVVGSASVLGGDGNDQIHALAAPLDPPDPFSEASSVMLDGGRGNDSIEWDGGAHSRILGGAGNDQIRTRSQPLGAPGRSFDYVVDGGPGNDTIDSDGGDGIITVLGGEGNDRISMADVDTTGIDGGPGDDVIEVGAGEFLTVSGGDGNDQLTVSLALPFVSVFGGAGNDQIMTSGGDTPRLDGGPGNDIITVGPSAPGPAFVTGGDGNDQITATGEDGTPRLLEGGNGNDVLVSSTADTLDGGPATDVCRSAPGGVLTNCEGS
jgi:Ca2+-binding RTX toxin-like protein